MFNLIRRVLLLNLLVVTVILNKLCYMSFDSVGSFCIGVMSHSPRRDSSLEPQQISYKFNKFNVCERDIPLSQTSSWSKSHTGVHLSKNRMTSRNVKAI